MLSFIVSSYPHISKRLERNDVCTRQQLKIWNAIVHAKVLWGVKLWGQPQTLCRFSGQWSRNEASRQWFGASRFFCSFLVSKDVWVGVQKYNRMWYTMRWKQEYQCVKHVTEDPLYKVLGTVKLLINAGAERRLGGRLLEVLRYLWYKFMYVCM